MSTFSFRVHLPSAFRSFALERAAHPSFPLALAELDWLYRIEQACLLREAACLRSALLPAEEGLEESQGRGDTLARARWFAAWQPTGPCSFATWQERVVLLLRAMEADGRPAASILRACAESDLAEWPTASRLARDAETLDPCPYGRLVVARSRLVDGRISAARRELESLCEAARLPGSHAAIPRAVYRGALATLAALRELGRPASEDENLRDRQSHALARRAFLLEPKASAALMLFALSLRSGRSGSARRAATVLSGLSGEDFAAAIRAPLRGLQALAALRDSLPPEASGRERVKPLWIEFLGSGDARLFDICLQLIHLAR